MTEQQRFKELEETSHDLYMFKNKKKSIERVLDGYEPSLIQKFQDDWCLSLVDVFIKSGMFGLTKYKQSPSVEFYVLKFEVKQILLRDMELAENQDEYYIKTKKDIDELKWDDFNIDLTKDQPFIELVNILESIFNSFGFINTGEGEDYIEFIESIETYLESYDSAKFDFINEYPFYDYRGEISYYESYILELDHKIKSLATYKTELTNETSLIDFGNIMKLKEENLIK